ncbi:hypothetical protein [Rhodococcoides kyotonense]|uniref:Uncharacterized protein n=1 Tax=Rhodococcoides kyotonense TaxID=398843 RepID=A0A177YE49_9NOCA|nr:hypothetical protein [Rhodococcus kyotonensis]OAK53826.1 hypothetical protein A3K89_22170 [Rhodococcus kyotonensis]
MASIPSEIVWQAKLFTFCAIPGCDALVATPGDVCIACQRAFGDMLQAQDGPVVDAEQVAAEFAARDADVLAHYRRPRRDSACAGT